MLVELLDLDLLWTDVSLELLDFVVENELELLQLLDLLLKLPDLVVFLLDGGYPSSILLFTGGDVSPDLRLLIDFALQ